MNSILRIISMSLVSAILLAGCRASNEASNPVREPTPEQTADNASVPMHTPASSAISSEEAGPQEGSSKAEGSQEESSTEEGSTEDRPKEVLVQAIDKEMPEVTADHFQEGVYIDFDSYKRSFFDDEIIMKLSNSLHAVVEQDEEQFQRYLKESSTGHGYFFGDSVHEDQFMFNDIDLLEKLEQPEQIRVGVWFARKSADGTVVNTGITYFFMMNKEGDWEIANID